MVAVKDVGGLVAGGRGVRVSHDYHTICQVNGFMQGQSHDKSRDSLLAKVVTIFTPLSVLS